MGERSYINAHIASPRVPAPHMAKSPVPRRLRADGIRPRLLLSRFPQVGHNFYRSVLITAVAVKIFLFCPTQGPLDIKNNKILAQRTRLPIEYIYSPKGKAG